MSEGNVVTKNKLPLWTDDLAASLPPLLDRREAASVLRCSTRTLDRRIRLGVLAATRHGDRVLIPRASIIDLLAGS
jgi:excisionase family DNA binding protein